MMPEELSPSSLTMNEVMARIEEWRNTRKRRKPMPEELWEAAASLSKEYSIHRISKALRLNYTALKKRIQPDECSSNSKAGVPAFIELDLASSSISECIVEMEDGSGAKMRMHFRGKTDFDLLELGKAFWGKKV